MATLTYPATIIGGTTEDVSQLNSNLTAIQQVVNSLDDANISATAGIQASKLASGVTGLARGAFGVYRNAAVSLTNGSVVPFDTEDFDFSGWHDTVTNIGRYTPQVAGAYRLSWSVTSNAAITADNWWQANLHKNGTLHKAGNICFQRGVVSVASVGSHAVQANGTTDFFTVVITHNVGATTAISPGVAGTYFGGELIGPS